MRFAYYRKRAKLSQMAVAKAIGVSDAAVCQWEKGDSLPEAIRLPEIAKLYKCKIDDLFKDEPDGKEDQ